MEPNSPVRRAFSWKLSQRPVSSNRVPPEAVVRGVAGALASELSMLLLYPLDTIRVLLQVEAREESKLLLGQTLFALVDIVQTEGVLVLYRGLMSTMVALGVSYFVYFFFYSWLKPLLAELISGQKGNTKGSTLSDMCASATSGVISVLITSPFWVACMRLKFAMDSASHETGGWLLLTIIHIWRSEGLSALWGGLSSSLVLVTNPIIQFVAYDALKRARLRLRHTASAAASPQDTLSSREAFIAGALSKMVATIATYPLQVVQALQRSRNPKLQFSLPIAEISMCHLLLELVWHHGASSLFRGLEAKFLQTVLNGALMFMFYESIASFLLRLAAIRAPCQKDE